MPLNVKIRGEVTDESVADFRISKAFPEISKDRIRMGIYP
jgi:hypothetical protein